MERSNIVERSDDELSLKDIIKKFNEWKGLLISKWKLILYCCIIGGALGVTYAIVKKPVYTAQLSFALEDSKSGGGLSPYAGIASQFGLDLGGSGSGAFSGDNLMELMKSRSNIEKALLTSVKINNNEETLAEFYIDFNRFRDKWSGNTELSKIHFLPGADNSKFSLKQDSLLGEFCKALLLNNLTVDKADKKLSIINVTVRSKNELFSKYFTEVLVDKVSQFYIETKTKKSVQNVSILQHQTDSVKRELNAAINGVASSADVNPNANPNRAILRVPAQHRQVDVQINTAILTEFEKNLEIAKVSLRNETPLIQIIDTPILPLEKEKIGLFKASVLGFLFGFLIAVIALTIKEIIKGIIA